MSTVFEREENAYTLGVQAGLWGYPLAHRVLAFPKGLAVKGLGLNSFQRFPRLKTADDRFVVTPNNLTIDSYAVLDLRRGPVALFVPPMVEQRWFIVQIGDAFDDVVLNLGGNRPAVPGPYLLVGPDFQGRGPGDMPIVRFRTAVGFIGLRIAVHGDADVPAAVELQNSFAAMPLRTYLEHGISHTETDYGPIDFAPLTAPEDLQLFDALGAALQAMLPASADVNNDLVQGLGTIGLSVAKGFDWQSLDESTLAGLRRAAPMVERITDERWATIGDTVNGWRGSRATGRVSFDWALNAANVKNQVGTELADQVIYLNTRVDGDGGMLNGANRYELRFEPSQLPPVVGMWNLAMYDDDMFFIPNDIDRYSIGSTTDGLAPAADDSLTVIIQHEQPAADQQANWLPAPAGSFNLTFRFYGPLASVISASYELPAVTRLT